MSAFEHYERVALAYDAVAHERFYRHVADELFALLPSDLTPRSILEIGAGTGFATAALRERFPDSRLDAVEPSSAMLVAARRRVPDARFQPCTLADACVGPADLVACSVAAHWLSAEDRRRLLDLARDGVLALSVPVALEPPLPAGNLLLQRLAWRLRARPSWERGARAFAHELAGRASAARRLVVRETYPDARSLADSLRTRGALMAVLGEGCVEEAHAVLCAHASIGPLEFAWAFDLLIVDGRGYELPRFASA